jgi:transcriptional regulator GlxA family with amidase domain
MTEGFTLLCLAGFVEVLRAFCDQGTNYTDDRCSWTLLADGNLRSSGGISILPPGEQSDPSGFDYVVLIGGKRPRREPLSAESVRFLRAADHAGVPLVSVTAGTFELARLGLLEDRSVCVHWDQLREFNIEFPELKARSDVIFMVDDDRVTCAGGTYVIDLAIYLLARHFGHEEVRTTMSLMGLHEIREPSHFQKHLFRSSSIMNELRINRLARMIETCADDPPSVAQMAQQLHVTPRHLERIVRQNLGVTPAQFASNLRLRRAQWLVQNTGKSISEVAYECGFSDASHLIRGYKKEFGITPNKMRKESARTLSGDMLQSLRRWGER